MAVAVKLSALLAPREDRDDRRSWYLFLKVIAVISEYSPLWLF